MKTLYAVRSETPPVGSPELLRRHHSAVGLDRVDRQGIAACAGEVVKDAFAAGVGDVDGVD